MTQNEYNVSGVRGGLASAQNAHAMAHLPISLGGQSPAYNIAGRIYQKFERAQEDITPARPIKWQLEPQHVQLRQAIIAKLGDIGYLEAIAYGLNEIHIIGVYAVRA